MWFILIGLFCFLAVVGFLLTGRPFRFAIGGIIFLIALVFIFVVVIVIWTIADPCSAPFTGHNSYSCQNQPVSTPVPNPVSNSLKQTIATPSDPFPFSSSQCNSTGCPQYEWYDNHNVAMAYRCYTSSSCSAEDWAFAIYGNKDDSRGEALKQQADEANVASLAKYPSGKCVTEQGIKICDLSFSVKKTYGDGGREVNFEANAIDCVNVSNGSQTQNQGDSVMVSSNNIYCVSDLGAVYIDPTIQVVKHFGEILKNNSNSSYYLPSSYGTCVWTYEDGNGAIPFMEVSSEVGPSTGYNVGAFCRNGTNQVDIYSYKG